MRIFALIFIAAFASSAIAGDKGNLIGKRGTLYFTPKGYTHGDAVVCKDKNFNIKSAFILEYSELDSIENSVIKFDRDLTDVEFVNSLANILEKEAPDLFQGFRSVGTRLASQAANFMSNRAFGLGVNFITNSQVIVLNPDRVTKAPKKLKGCAIEKAIASQKTSMGMLFTVQADLFASLSQRDRRGLIIHEALYYSIQRYYRDEDSARTRYIHQRLIQHDLKELTSTVVADILTKAFLEF